MSESNLRVFARASAVLALAVPGAEALAATAQTEAALASLPAAIATAAGGLVLAGGSVAAILALRPRDEKRHWLMINRQLESLLPVSIVSALALGIALLIAGIANIVN
jgi:hypothetical protein